MGSAPMNKRNARRPHRSFLAVVLAPLRWVRDFVMVEVPVADADKPAPRAAARPRPASKARQGSGPGTYLTVALVGVAVLAVVIAGARWGGAPPPSATSSPTQASHSTSQTTTARSSSASARSSVASQSTTGTSAATGGPDCASMQMREVPPVAGAAHPVISGLCASLGNGENWKVGCAPGFQTTCGPALRPMIACLYKVGAQQPIATADVETCAQTVEKQLAGGG